MVLNARYAIVNAPSVLEHPKIVPLVKMVVIIIIIINAILIVLNTHIPQAVISFVFNVIKIYTY